MFNEEDIANCQVGHEISVQDIIMGIGGEEIGKTMMILGWENVVFIIDSQRDKWIVESLIFPLLIKNEIDIKHGEVFVFDTVIGIIVSVNSFKGVIICLEDREIFLSKILNLPENYPVNIVSKELKRDHFTGKDGGKDG